MVTTIKFRDFVQIGRTQIGTRVAGSYINFGTPFPAQPNIIMTTWGTGFDIGLKRVTAGSFSAVGGRRGTVEWIALYGTR